MGCNSNCRAHHPGKLLFFQPGEQETGQFMQLTCHPAGMTGATIRIAYFYVTLLSAGKKQDTFAVYNNTAYNNTV
jgi:hypothetical protein